MGTRRLNQIQKEFTEKKEGVQQQREGNSGMLPLHEGHKRSSSHFDSSFSSKMQQLQSSPFKDHERNSSDPDTHGGGGGARAGANSSAPASSLSSQSALSDQQQLPAAAALRPSGIPPMPSSGEVTSLVTCHPHQNQLPPNFPKAVRSSGEGGQKQIAIIGNVSSICGASTNALRNRSGSVSS